MGTVWSCPAAAKTSPFTEICKTKQNDTNLLKAYRRGHTLTQSLAGTVPGTAPGLAPGEILQQRPVGRLQLPHPLPQGDHLLLPPRGELNLRLTIKTDCHFERYFGAFRFRSLKFRPDFETSTSCVFRWLFWHLKKRSDGFCSVNHPHSVHLLSRVARHGDRFRGGDRGTRSRWGRGFSRTGGSRRRVRAEELHFPHSPTPYSLLLTPYSLLPHLPHS